MILSFFKTEAKPPGSHAEQLEIRVFDRLQCKLLSEELEDSLGHLEVLLSILIFGVEKKGYL